MRIAILSANPNLYSTQRLLEAVHQRGHEGVVVNHLNCQVMIEGGKPSVLYEGRELDPFDAIVPRIGASVTDYGCAIVRQFEMMKVFTTAKSQAITRSRNKLRSLQVLSKAGVGLPKTVFANHPKNGNVTQLIELVGGPPVVIKLLEGTQGIGVVLAETAKAAKSTIEAFYGLKKHVLVQEFVAEAKGSDLRAFVVGGRVIGAMKRQGLEGEFRSNIHRGGNAFSVDLTPDEEQTAIEAARALGLKVAGVDMLPSERGPLVLEVNSSPGLEGIETATGINVADQIIAYIEDKIRADEGDMVGV
ncbi:MULTISPECIES: 30S ribosomal protein S6--L-glutamate ligase [Spirosoma]|uniref:30S ribosomal protein S6--L-glutamate ligase n=1 Tax=Spirosoma liriopis TaxID=2937440 RepID=A0ABT0HJM2_9BACT|nr:MULTISPECIES: 30S ribosomal protein S6--L-glutamate ligase [Spirosoma]MCK8492364.1 30S ribosomal protein S6--L-glutamate ligase [Spirosoma liriopis]UHG91837.1 30S ribosomal protein S6--L-glutamate ligase [Spirosoma oryzicola]